MSGNQQPQGQQNTVPAFGFKPASNSEYVSSTPSTNIPFQPSPFGSFGAKPPTPANATPTPVSGTPFLPSLFNGTSATTANKAVTATSAANAPSPLPPGPLFPSLPKKPEAAPASSTSSGTPSTFAGFANLTTSKDSNKEAGKDDISDKPGGLFGQLANINDGSKDQTKDAPTNKGGPQAPPAFVTFSHPGAKDAVSPKTSGTLVSTPGVPAPTALTAATPAVAPVPAPSMLRGKSVEDIVNRWTTELETHMREFSQFASEVAVWDRTLIENGNYISALYATVLTAESTQASLDQSLDHVEQQQRHLTATLDQYEKSANEILRGPGGIMTSTEGLGLADSERDKSYALAANLYTQLDDISRSLSQMVDAVNSLNLSPGPSRGTTDDASQEDAITTIAGILNAHLASLQWIDVSLTGMDGKIKDAEKKIKDMGSTGGLRSSLLEGTSRSRSYGVSSSRR